LDHTDRQQDAQNAIDRISKCYRPNITTGFDVKHFRLIRSLGQGMNGSVRNLFKRQSFYSKLIFQIRFISYNMAEIIMQ
jgi:hypothetical protein